MFQSTKTRKNSTSFRFSGSRPSTPRKSKHNNILLSRQIMGKSAIVIGLFWAIWILFYKMEPPASNDSNNNNIQDSFENETSRHLLRTNNNNNNDIQNPIQSTPSSATIPQNIRLLRDIDRDSYTIRMNTWKRIEQLQVSVEHHASCPGVAQIQIVWCDPDEDPPEQLLNHSKVVIERHTVNSLNERFNVLSPSPTLGILSIDDDVLRPCIAIDSGFFKWVQNPDRMVGFDGRLHVQNDNGDESWQYGYLSTMEKANQYSLSLTRYCFIHLDYLHMYTNNLPRPIYNVVAKNFNCEDIAMSLMISSMTNGSPPLLADLWAIKSMIKLYSAEKISGTNNHKALRDNCVNSFAEQLGIKDGTKQLKTAPFIHHGHYMFECGELVTDTTTTLYAPSERQQKLELLVKAWKENGNDSLQHDVRQMMAHTGYGAYQHGLIEKSDKWKQRFHHHKTRQ